VVRDALELVRTSLAKLVSYLFGSDSASNSAKCKLTLGRGCGITTTAEGWARMVDIVLAFFRFHALFSHLLRLGARCEI